MIEPVTHQTVYEWAKLASSVWSASKEQLIDGFYQEQYPYEFLYWLNGSAVGFAKNWASQKGLTQYPLV